jgi:SprB repeat
MKKIFLLFVFTIFYAFAFGQEYEMKVKFNVMYNANDVKCSSHVKLTFFTASGRTWEWYQGFNMNEDEWREYTKTFSFSLADRITKINCESHRYTENAFDCTHRGGGSKDVTINATDYPCGDRLFTGVFEGYDGSSSLDVEIKPLSNTYAIQTEAQLKSNRNMFVLGYEVKLKYSNNTIETVSQMSKPGVGNGESFVSRETVLKSGKGVRVTEVQVRTFYLYQIFSVVDETRVFPVTDANPNADFDVTLNDPFYQLASGSSLRVRYGRPLTPIDYGPDATNILPSENDVTLSIREPYTSGYRWRYQVQGQLWRDVPLIFGSGKKITISGKKLFDAAGIDYNTNLFKNILFKAQYTCTSGRETQTVTLRHLPSSPGITLVSPIQETCFGFNDGKLQINFDRPLYSNELLYIFINGETFDTYPNELDGSNSITISNRSPGTYNISLLSTFGSSGNGYSDGANHRATQTIQPRTPISNFTAIVANVHCFNGEDGKVDISAQGGTANYTGYLILGTDTVQQINLTSSAGNSFVNLKAGEYIARLKDSNGCDPKDGGGNVIYRDGSITQPTQKVSLSTVENVEPLGFGLQNGYITVRSENGTNPYTFSWTDTNNNPLTANPPVPEGSSIKSTLNGIGKGIYRVRAQDSNYALASPQSEVNVRGCYDTLSIVVDEPSLLEVVLEEQHFVSCNAYTDGELVAHAKGGRPYLSTELYHPYQYEWFTVNAGLPAPFGTSDSIATDRHAALYRIKVTDRNGIIAWSPDFILVQPDVLKVDFITSELRCNGDTNGTSQAVVQGGTAAYRYAWSTEETTSAINSLTDGWYSLVVTDVRGCTTYSQTEVKVPNSLEADAVLDYPTCNGYTDGSVTLTVTGGLAPYTYAWDHGSNTATATSLSEGAYHVQITDANGCFIKGDYVLEDPTLFPISLGPDRVLCKDQTLDLNVTITDPAAQYNWLKNGVGFASTPTVQLMDAGTYLLRITDSKGCSNEDEIKIERNDAEIAASIIAATRVPQAGKVRVANISHPSADRIEWIIPQEATILEQTPGYIDISFAAKGEYSVGLTSFKGSCEKSVYSTLRVVDKSELTDYKAPDEPYIKQFMVTPNPNNGRFAVIVELREVGSFSLIMNTAQGTAITRKDFNQQSFARIDFDVSAQTGKGIYILQLVTAHGYATFKVAID